MRKIINTLLIIMLTLMLVGCFLTVDDSDEKGVNNMLNSDESGVMDEEVTDKTLYVNNTVFGDGYEKHYPSLEILITGLRKFYYLGELIDLEIEVRNIPDNAGLALGFVSGEEQSLKPLNNMGKKQIVFSEEVIVKQALEFEYYIIVYDRTKYKLKDVTDKNYIAKSLVKSEGVKETEEVEELYYYKGNRVDSSDRESFELLYDDRFARDNKTVYINYDGFFHPVRGITPNGFKYFGKYSISKNYGGVELLVDENGVFTNYLGLALYDYNFDIENFTNIGNFFFSDNNNVYVFQIVPSPSLRVIDISQHPTSFESLTSCAGAAFLYDDKFYYYNNLKTTCMKALLDKYSSKESVKVLENSPAVKLIKFDDNLQIID